MRFTKHSTEECFNKVNELDGEMDIVFVDGKIAADRLAMLIKSSVIANVILAPSSKLLVKVLGYPVF